MTVDLGLITENDVHEALAFFIAIEPDPATIASREEWEAALAPHATGIKTANTVIRRYAEEMQPATLEQMQDHYYEFTSNRRYLDTSLKVAVVTSVLQTAWDRVGPWRK